MQPGDRSRPSFVRRAARAAVLLSSGSLAAVLVFRSGGSTGCDGPSSPPPETKSAPAASQEQAPASVTPPAALGPAAATQPAPAPAPQPTSANEPAGSLLDAPSSANNAGNAGPRYFPASKSGVFIEHDRPAPEPQREPAAQQQAPSPAQQAGPR